MIKNQLNKSSKEQNKIGKMLAVKDNRVINDEIAYLINNGLEAIQMACNCFYRAGYHDKEVERMIADIYRLRIMLEDRFTKKITSTPACL